ncbi:MAG: CubicO group peptidase (beta-lactamase class C family), partial [Mariniblastus sp.]
MGLGSGMMKCFAMMLVGTIGWSLFASNTQAAQVNSGSRLEVLDPSEIGISAEKLAKVDRAMEDSIRQNRIAGGIVVIARGGKVGHFKSYGKMDLEANKPMQNDAIFRIYSMSKSVTSAAALMLYDEGKLHFNDPVSKYIPELKNVQVADGDKLVPVSREITVGDLMLHTAGYSYGDSKQDAHNEAYAELKMLDTSVTLEEFGKKLGQLPLAFQPGTDWKYGISIDVLGRVVEVASGKTLEEFFCTRIFEPLGMSDTGFYVPAEKIERFA